MLHGKIGSICVAVFLSCVFLSGSSQVVQISVNAENQHDPAIHGSIVVWEDERNGNFDIYGFNMLTSEEIQITENASNQYDPAIYGNIVVWMDERNGNYDIYGSDLSTQEEFQVTTNEENQINPAIYQDLIVWQDYRHGNWDVYGYNLSTSEEIQITSNESSQINPAIYEKIIVWQDYRNGNWDIYGYNLSTSEEIQITTHPENQTAPAIYGTYVIWEDSRNGNLDIYGFNLSTSEEIQITTHPENQTAPAIYNNIVVWEDERNGNTDIYGFNLLTSEDLLIEATPALQQNPAIYENTVVWEDERNANYDIYGVSLLTISTLTITVAVEDSEGTPIPEASVTLGPYTGTTDETGMAVLSDVAAGTYTLTISAPGFRENVQIIEIIESATVTILLVSEMIESTESVTGFTVEFIVQDTMGQPVAGATVTMTGPLTYTSTTDTQGVTMISAVSGTYTLTVSHLDYSTHTDTAFEVSASTTTVIILNTGTGFIHGTVYWDTTKTLAKEVAVHIYDQANKLEKIVMTDFQGRFVAEVPSGMYSVVVEGFAEQKQVGIVPVSSLDTGAMAIVLDPQSSVKGVVTDESDTVIVGAQVAVKKTTGDLIAQGSTDSSGLFTVDIVPGTHSVEISAPGYQSFTQVFTISHKEVYDLGVIALREKPESRIDIQEEEPPVDEEVTKPAPSQSVMIPVLITLGVCAFVVVVVIMREKNRKDLVRTVVISIFTGIIAIILMWILFQIG